jgi:mono/diheme cytochrome c family protein
MASNGNVDHGNDQDNYNRGGLIVFIISMVVSFGVLIYVSFFSGGVDLKEVPESVIAADATQSQAASAPVEQKKIDVSKIKDPWIPSEDLVAYGQQIFKTNCVMCHGAEGKGDGVAGASLNPKPRNFVEGKWKLGGTRLGLFQVLQEGLKGSSMQSYKHLPSVDRWALVHYIRSITQNKVADNDAEVAKKAPSLK